MIGFKQMATMYFAAGIGGNIFSSCINDEPSVGASTAVFGVLTGQAAMIIVNWSAFNSYPQLKQVRCMLLFFVCLMLVFNFLAEVGGPPGVVDVTGHIGGAIVGLIWGLAFFPRVKTEVSAKMRLAGIVLTIGFFSILILYFFIFRKPKDLYGDYDESN